MMQPTVTPPLSLEKAAIRALVFLLVLSTVFLISISLQEDFHISLTKFLTAHSLTEAAGIFIASMIVVVGWLPLEEKRYTRTVILTCAFLAAGILESIHLFTYGGLNDQAIAVSRELSLHYSIAAQAFIVLGLVGLILVPQLTISEHMARGIALLFLALTWLSIMLIASETTSLYSLLPEQRPGHVLIQRTLALLYLIAGISLWRRSIQHRNLPLLGIACASLVLAMSSMLFSVYFHSNDLANLLGHLFKLAAYILLFRSLVIFNIRQPYWAMENLKNRFESTLNALPDLVFETAGDGRIHQFHSNPAHSDLLVKPEAFLGHYLQEFLPDEAIDAWKESLAETRKNGHCVGYQYTLVMPNGIRRFEISSSQLQQSDPDERFILIIRDVTERHSLTERLKALLELAERSEGMNDRELARLGLEMLESLTNSPCSYLHVLSEDEKSISLFAAGPNAQTAESTDMPPISRQGVWQECVRSRKPTLHNDLQDELTPDTPRSSQCSHLTRIICVPIFEGERIAMIVSVADSAYPYHDSTISTLELFGNELNQLIQRRRAYSELASNRILLRSALEYLPVGVAITRNNPDVHFEYFNPQFPAIYHISPDAITNIDTFSRAIFEDENQRSQLLDVMAKDVASGDLARMHWDRLRISHPGQADRYVNVQLVPVDNSDLNVVLIEDVTEAMEREEELRISATAFSSQEGMMITDANLKILRVNDAFLRDTGFSAEDVVGKTPSFLRSGLQDDAFYRVMWNSINETGVWRGEVQNRNKQGTTTPYSLTISAVRNELNQITHYIGDYIDLSDLRSAEEKISQLSYFDTLTGLPNREFLKTLVSDIQFGEPKANSYLGAMMVDIDSFKTINETLGHEAGDRLLLQISQRLRNHLGEQVSLARYGGDEFVAVFPDFGKELEQSSLKLQLLAQSLLAVLEDSYQIDKQVYFSTASIGATLIESRRVEPLSLLQQLEIALTEAKKAGTNLVRFFDPSLQESISQRARLLDEFRTAILEHQLELYYQPQLNRAREIIGAEALLRWNHPVRGVLPPSEFLPIAEQNRLTLKMGEEVLRMGLNQLHDWQQQEKFRHLKLSLNITADQFSDPQFEKTLQQQLDSLSITEGSLMLELTESMLLGNIEETRSTIERLNEWEVEFAIDDFGTGYSSLSYLSTLPMDQLKIDQSFVRNIGKVESDATIVRTIINMAHALKLQVIAEGVETEAQCSFLAELGCDLYQGYLFGKPLPISCFNALYSRQAASQDE